MEELSPDVKVVRMIPFPMTLNHTRRGSVSVFEPDPSDNADLVVSSCNASEAAIKTESSGNAGFSSVISRGMTDVKSLKGSEISPRCSKIQKDLLSL